jgi:hypothetical protein
VLDNRTRFDLIARNVEEIAPTLLGKREIIEQRIDNYLNLAAYWNLEGDEKLHQEREHKLALYLSPIVVLGAALHLVPYQVVGPLVRVLRPHPAFAATYKVAIGLILFLIWYLLLAGAVWGLTGSILWGLVTFVGTIAGGVIANRYYRPLRIALLSRSKSRAGSPIEVLTRFRDELIAELEELRVV